jgi:hypothetical protein
MAWLPKYENFDSGDRKVMCKALSQCYFTLRLRYSHRLSTKALSPLPPVFRIALAIESGVDEAVLSPEERALIIRKRIEYLIGERGGEPESVLDLTQSALDVPALEIELRNIHKLLTETPRRNALRMEVLEVYALLTSTKGDVLMNTLDIFHYADWVIPTLLLLIVSGEEPQAMAVWNQLWAKIGLTQFAPILAPYRDVPSKLKTGGSLDEVMEHANSRFQELLPSDGPLHHS